MSDMNFMTMQRPQSFIYSSFKLGKHKGVGQGSNKKVLRDSEERKIQP